MGTEIRKLLGAQADHYLGFSTPKIPKERLHLPGPDFVDRIVLASDRNNRVVGNLQWMFQHGRLAGTGYLSILPVGYVHVECSACDERGAHQRREVRRILDDEAAASGHSTIRSARTMRSRGIVNPSVRAVRRLIARSAVSG